MKKNQIGKKLWITLSVLILLFITAFSCYAVTGTRDSSWTTTDEAVNAIVGQMNNALGASASEYDKALWLHDWLTDNAYYALDENGVPSNEDWAHSAEGVLLRGSGVCESYSKAYQLLLNKVNIENKMVTGTATNSSGNTVSHAWNLVKLNGSWTRLRVCISNRGPQ